MLGLEWQCKSAAEAIETLYSQTVLETWAGCIPLPHGYLPLNQHFGRISAWNEEAPVFAEETSVLQVFDVKHGLENWKLSPEPSKGDVGTCIR